MHERQAVLTEVHRDLADENIKAATKALEAGLLNGEPWVARAESIIQSHANPLGHSDDPTKSDIGSFDALEAAEQGLSDTEKKEVKAFLLQLGHGDKDLDKRRNALHQIAEAVETNGPSATGELARLGEILPNNEASNFLDRYKNELVEYQNLATYLSDLGNGTIDWRHEGLPAGFIREYNEQLQHDGDRSVHAKFHAPAVDQRIAPIELPPNHEQQVAAHERISAFPKPST